MYNNQGGSSVLLKRSNVLKRFKFCTEEQFNNAYFNHKYGNPTSFIYVWDNGNYVETLEVISEQTFLNIFDNVNEMYEWFAESGTPLIKDFEEGKQAQLF